MLCRRRRGYRHYASLPVAYATRRCLRLRHACCLITLLRRMTFRHADAFAMLR